MKKECTTWIVDSVPCIPVPVQINFLRKIEMRLVNFQLTQYFRDAIHALESLKCESNVPT